MATRRIISSLLVIALSAALLVHFFLIWYYVELLLSEPNIIVKSLETFGLLAIFAFGIYGFMKELRK